jgi:hypothetical protein
MEPSLWQRTRKAFNAALAAGVAAATPTLITLQDGGLNLTEVGAILGAFVAGAVPTFVLVFATGNVPSTQDLAAAQQARRKALG